MQHVRPTPTAAPRRGDNPARRREILDAALSVLAERGYRDTTMLEAARGAGAIAFDDAEEAVEAFLGLLLGDRQVRRLLGPLPEPAAEERRACADRAVRRFIRAFAPEAGA